jgi:hypothetical protein
MSESFRQSMRMSKPGMFSYDDSERITKKHIFKLRKEELENLFKKENLESRGKSKCTSV